MLGKGKNTTMFFYKQKRKLTFCKVPNILVYSLN